MNAPAANMPAANNAASNAANGASMMGGGHKMSIGSKAQVFHGSAHHTRGGLTRKDLMKNKRGKIVSRRQAKAGKRAYTRLVKAGYKPKKGQFKLFSRKR